MSLRNRCLARLFHFAANKRHVDTNALEPWMKKSACHALSPNANSKLQREANCQHRPSSAQSATLEIWQRSLRLSCLADTFSMPTAFCSYFGTGGRPLESHLPSWAAQAARHQLISGTFQRSLLKCERWKLYEAGPWESNKNRQKARSRTRRTSDYAWRLLLSKFDCICRSQSQLFRVLQVQETVLWRHHRLRVGNGNGGHDEKGRPYLQVLLHGRYELWKKQLQEARC